MDKHKLWLIIGIVMAVLLVGFLVLYAASQSRGALFGKAILATQSTSTISTPSLPTVSGSTLFIQSCMPGTALTAGVTYKLAQDISTTGACFQSFANGVTIDCDGHVIQGLPTDGLLPYNAIYVNAKTGVTIKNCEIRGFQRGIRVEGISSVTIEKNKICDSTVRDFLCVSASTGAGAGNLFARLSFCGNGWPVSGINAVSCFVGAICGNGVAEFGEKCDDGNTANSDGCSSVCVVELAAPAAVCGNGVVESPETCDDGNLANGDGCSATCVKEVIAAPLPPATEAICNNVLDDDGDSLTDCKDPNCNFQPGPTGICCQSNADCYPDSCSNNVCAAAAPAPTLAVAGEPVLVPSLPVCGNGIIEGTEACDDKNTINGDGCSASCVIELKLAVASAVCGNGIVEGTETCDDKNLVNGDGCSATCVKEIAPTPKLAVAGEPVIISVPICGDAKVEGTEACDDGNLGNGDGCSSLCALEPKVAPPPPTLLAVEVGGPVSLPIPGDTNNDGKVTSEDTNIDALRIVWDNLQHNLLAFNKFIQNMRANWS